MASNAPTIGGYDYKFVETPPDKLVCQICLLVARSPHQVTCCGKVYCKTCLDEHKRHSLRSIYSKECPNCRKIGQNFPDIRGEWTLAYSWRNKITLLYFFLYIGEQEIKSLKVKCNNRESKCGWVGEFRSLDDHFKTCEYILLRCTNECTNNTSKVYVLRRDLDHHLKNECPNRQYQCPHCKVTERYCDITTTHLYTCPKVKVSCPNDGCKTLVPRCNLSEHLTVCEYALLHCPNECMENTKVVKISCHDLDQHLKNECPNRQYQCRHCETIGRYCDITTTHLDTCPKVKIPCPNTDCKASVPRCDLSTHRSTCEFEKVPCKYAKAGCEEEPLRKDQQQHENDATLHLHIAIETVNKQHKEITKQREEIHQQQEEITKQQVVITKQQEEITKQRKEIDEQQKEMKAVKEEQKIISDTVMAGQSGPCAFKMPEFSLHKSLKQEWYGPPFYTHPGGYKMRIRVDANGCLDGAGTHVSVSAYLMQGRNDDILEWPFTGKVTFTLLNQLADKNHYTATTASFPQDHKASRRVVDDEMATTGYGQPTFISHYQLRHDVMKNCQYLKDDCLYFQIKVQATKPAKPWLKCTF